MGSYQTVLLVEQDAKLREALAVVLGRAGYDVTTAADGRRAIAAAADDLPDLLVVDMMLPGASGFEVLRAIEARADGRVPVIMTSPSPSAAHRDYALAAGADAYLTKPFPPAALAEAAVALCPPRVAVRDRDSHAVASGA